jgi:hypothetical protein
LTDLGTIPECTATPAEIGDPADATCGATCVDLDATLVDEYLVAIPTDPQDDGTYANGTGYTICETGTGRVQIDAPNAENRVITVMR